MTSLVTNGDWVVATTNSPDYAGVKLTVFSWDESTQTYTYAEGHGYSFTNTKAARKYALRKGYLKVFVPGKYKDTLMEGRYINSKREAFLNG